MNHCDCILSVLITSAKVHYINVDYLSSNGDTAGVDLLFTDEVLK